MEFHFRRHFRLRSKIGILFGRPIVYTGFDLPPGLPGFDPAWKIHDPAWRTPIKIKPGSRVAFLTPAASWLKAGHHSALDRPTGKQSRQPAAETRHMLFRKV